MFVVVAVSAGLELQIAAKSLAGHSHKIRTCGCVAAQHTASYCVEPVCKHPARHLLLIRKAQQKAIVIPRSGILAPLRLSWLSFNC